MTSEISLHDLRTLGKTRLGLSDKELSGKFTTREKVREALLDGFEILDSYDSPNGLLADYDVVDEYRNKATVEVYKEGEHTTEKTFVMEIETGRVDDESYRVMRVDFIDSGEIVEQLFIK